MDQTQLYSILTVAAFAIPLIAFLLYSFSISPEVDSEERFFFCSQQLTLRELEASFNASWVVAGAVIVTVMALGQIYGLHNWWVVLTFLCSWLVLARHTPAIRRYLTHKDKRTLHEFLGTTFGSPHMRKLVSLITVVTVTGVVALELIIGMAIFAALPALPEGKAIALIVGVLLAFVVCLYTVLGGLLATVRTDVIQWVGIISGMISAAIITYLYFGADPLALSRLREVDLWAPSGPLDLWPLYLGVACNQIPVVMADFGTWQRIGASRMEDLPKLPRTAVRAGIFQALVWALLAGLGIAVVAMSAPDPTVANSTVFGGVADPIIRIIHACIELGSASPVLGGLLLFTFCIGIVCAILSSADSYLIAATQTLTRDFRGISTAEGVSDKRVLFEARMWAVVLILCALGIAIVATIMNVPLIPLVFTFYGALVVIAILAIFALRAERTSQPIGTLGIAAVFFVYALSIGFGFYTSFSPHVEDFWKLNGGFLVAAIAVGGVVTILSIKLASEGRKSAIIGFWGDLLGLRRYREDELQHIENSGKAGV